MYASCNEIGIGSPVLGHSGKITLAYDDPSYNNSQVIDFSSIYELNAQEEVIGNTGSIKHSVNSFASQDFDFSDMVSTTFQGLACSNLNFTTAMVDGQATLQVLLYIFSEAGNIITYNETLPVEEGSMKFSVVVKDWPFCTLGGSGKINQLWIWMC